MTSFKFTVVSNSVMTNKFVLNTIIFDTNLKYSIRELSNTQTCFVNSMSLSVLIRNLKALTSYLKESDDKYELYSLKSEI